MERFAHDPTGPTVIEAVRQGNKEADSAAVHATTSKEIVWISIMDADLYCNVFGGLPRCLTSQQTP